MGRISNFLVGMIISVLLLLPMLLVVIAVRATSTGPVIYWSDRVGKDNIIFKMPKFRSMRVDTPVLATHLLTDPDEFLTPIGSFLRRTSLDELPQIYSILKGDMNLVGPRPALYNQYDLITLRTDKGVSQEVPGVTGWAQINGRDELSIEDKVELDVEYMEKRSWLFDLKILWMTFFKVISNAGISH